MSEHEHEHGGEHAATPQTSTHDARWMGWTFALLAIPLLYVLTLPPIVLTVCKVGGLPVMINPPKWVRVYGAPYEWLVGRPPLQEPLQKYGSWWAEQFGFGYTPAAPPPAPPSTSPPTAVP